MKLNARQVFTLVAIIFVSCFQPKEKATGDASTTDSTVAANDVTVTAPDSQDKKQQGYNLPGLDHGFEQSPINIISTVNDAGKHKITLILKMK